MMFFEAVLRQKNKNAHAVCGDYCVCERTAAGMIYVVCDGVGSGIYANISAITCASRILELFHGGMSIRLTSETIAASMHRARTEDIPFSAFSAVMILTDGQFTAYSYEAPNPVLLQNGHATTLAPRFYTAGFEVIGEVSGALHIGDSLLLFSDGVSQAGLGHGYGMGIGSDGVSDYVNRIYKPDDHIALLPQRIMEMCKTVSAGNYEDDTTLALIHCREAKELTILTGPPSKQSMDRGYVSDFMDMPGEKVICGSTTTDIAARELGLEVVTLSMGNAFGQPPEYWIEGIDLVAEGAVTLNQVYNILDEPVERLSGSSVAERLCLMLRGADVIHLMIGNAVNTAHKDLIFKQIGVSVRKATIQQIVEKLKSMDKLVIERYY
ncbi:MAG: serine/threonine-protein phosphatase [Oscillospiraceae bacterium]|jgi:serine phosphatase RsbU (regulator of sigma subunit)|nr:serine/threonine-protein phosphatase [Oscillospiraceae bacterium]